MSKTNELFNDYVSSISKEYSQEDTTEMGYRKSFELLLEGIFEQINVKRIAHDAKARQGNKPDFVIYKGEVPILYLETKDIGVSLDKIEKSEQMTRYFGYTNLVLSDYLEFRFYRNGIPYGEPIFIGTYDKKNRQITPRSDAYEGLAKTLLDFAQSHKEPIKSGSHLAKIMGGKAQRIRDNVLYHLEISTNKDPNLLKLYEAIKSMLVHDLNFHTFSDMYAQTMVYGLFVARYYDKTPGNFTRKEARELIPNSNKLLKHFFDHIVGVEFKNSLKFIVDELCEVYSHADVAKLMEDYYKTNKENSQDYDPVIHFYEDFLYEYDPDLKRKMGAYYTPQPVVNFIVNSVDEILKKEFGLSKGLADTTKLPDGKHKVQVLDPATGTGTFISTVIDKIFEEFGKGQIGRWPAYVHSSMLPRIHGFELMMAPYTIAHLRIGINLKRNGFWDFHQRLGIYLTNALENNEELQLPFAFGLAESIAEESKEASVIKNKTPIMVVVGNPPYSGESSNENYHGNDVYKTEPTGGKLQERNYKWINDDYVKFIRFSESLVERNSEGIVAMITAHGYIDNPTFRGMRWHLMKTFDEIYILDLHGNANKKETAHDGSPDENVFDIKTGVAIFIGLKRNSLSKKQTKIFKMDLFGPRKNKFEYLNQFLINDIKWKEIDPRSPNFEWVHRNNGKYEEYLKGFSVKELFNISTVGIVTSRDEFVIDQSAPKLKNRILNFLQASSPDDAKATHHLKENKKWRVATAMKHEFNEGNIVPIAYRPFDKRFVYYHDDFIERSRKEVMSQFINKNNIGLVVMRQAQKDGIYSHVLVNNTITDNRIFYSGKGISEVMPLYRYNNEGAKESNLNQEIVNKIEGIVGRVSPEEIFSYTYGYLYSQKYREEYQDLLKSDFPRVPYPKNDVQFKSIARYGNDLRQIHLFESSKLNNFVTTYPVAGSDEVEKVEYMNGNVYINDEQYFGNISDAIWNLYIGGYQPAQKWLKDRKGKKLTDDDIDHYQKIIVVLTETNRLMKEIDLVLSNSG